jgi:hypothetical protein
MNTRAAALFALLSAFACEAQADVFAVQWTYPEAPVVPITGFRVYCGAVLGGPYDPAPVAVVGSNERQTQITVAQPDKRYCVVAAFNETADSLYSNELTLVSKPNAPVDFVVSGMQPNAAGAAAQPPAQQAQPAVQRPQGARAVPLPAPR